MNANGQANRTCDSRRAQCVYVAATLAALGCWLTPSLAHAERYYVVYERVEDAPPSALNLGFDLEGAIPTYTPIVQSGNNLEGGGGFKIRVGDQILLPRLRIIPEGGYGFDHLFATDDFGNAYAWDMHRLFGGVRLGWGRVIVPGFYAHLGYGWRNTADPTVPTASGPTFDAGFSLDFHLVPHLGFGGHIEYVTIDAEPFTPEWVAFGVHADAAFY
jgi:hypothetical protein